MTSREFPLLDPSSRLVSRTTERGLSMLELIIAFVVLQVAIVTFAHFFTAGLDFSRKARRMGMAQILAQAKMEELIRTLPLQSPLAFSADEAGMKRFVSERPGDFEDLVYAHSENVEPFMWVVEAFPLSEHEDLVNVTLHVYTVSAWTKSEEKRPNKEDFYLATDRRSFTYIAPVNGDSVQITRGKLKLSLSTAMALRSE